MQPLDWVPSLPDFVGFLKRAGHVVFRGSSRISVCRVGIALVMGRYLGFSESLGFSL